MRFELESISHVFQIHELIGIIALFLLGKVKRGAGTRFLLHRLVSILLMMLVTLKIELNT